MPVLGVGSLGLLSVARLVGLAKIGAGSEAVRDQMRISCVRPLSSQTSAMEMGTVDAGLVAMESVRGRSDPGFVLSSVLSRTLSLLIDQKEGAESK